MWQDIVITVCNIILSMSLLPQVYNGFRTKTGPIGFSTSVPYALCLFTISVALWTSGLLLSGVVTFLSGFVWTCFAVQRYIYNKKS